MAQKSILSFFSVKSESKKKITEDAEETICSEDDSPVKVARKRQRIVSSSGDEDNEVPKEKVEVKKTKLAAKLSGFAKTSKKNSPVKVEKKNGGEAEVKKKLSDVAKTSKKSSPVKVEKKASDEDSGEAEKEKKSSGVAKACNGNAEKSSPGKVKVETAVENGVSGDADLKVKEDDYNPNVERYKPVDHACWKKGAKVPYLALSRTLEEIEKTSARLKMIEILSNFLRSVKTLSPDDLLPSIYLCLNKIGPAYEGLELGIAEQTLIRAISQSTGRTFSQIKNDVTESGDLGTVAEKSRSSQRLMFRPQPLTVRAIFQKFREIAAMTGHSAVNKKINIIQGLFVACRGPEARFLIRSLNGKLRIGLAEQSVLQAIASACAEKCDKAKYDELALILKTTYCECPNYDKIVPVILEHGIEKLPEFCKITAGVPVKPMLAQPTKGVQEVLTRFDGLEFTCEWKYDGERAQIHGLDDKTIKIYSRNQEDNTSKYPDIINRVPLTKSEKVDTFILDCEAVAWDVTEKRILPFQILSTRKRKDANETDIKVQVCVFMFDLLYLNGRSLVREPFFERRKLLKELFKPVEGQWAFATAIDTSKMEEVQEFLEVSIKGQCEGLMVKTLKEEATYEIAKRSRNWLKLKKDYLEGVGDTLDLVIMGGYFGKGKRTGTYGGFLVGCYDEDNEEYQTLCKLGTGFSDENLQSSTTFFKDHVVEKAPAYYQYEGSLVPDHWFAPVQVWEIRCADLSLSPVHRAAVGLGISLRFPRFLRVRDDKKPEDATSSRQIADMYKSQEQVQAQGKTFNEEDFY